MDVHISMTEIELICLAYQINCAEAGDTIDENDRFPS
jgi:hypothetical protein